MSDLQEKNSEKERKLKMPGFRKKEMIDLKILQEQMHCLLNKEIEAKIKLLRLKEFEGANKPGCFSAWQIKKRNEKKSITGIKVHNKIITDQQHIKKAFRDFYVKLFEKNYNN